MATAGDDLQVSIEKLRTTGDRITDVPLARIGDHGLFTKEIDRAVLTGKADAAVHSLKDMPTQLPNGLVVAAVLSREDPRDAFVPGPAHSPALIDLPAGARVGTSSLRRRALLLNMRPDLEVVDLRGNLGTRLRAVERGAVDATIVAVAGVLRLGREDVVGSRLDPQEWLPAAGQGALAVVARAGDSLVIDRLRTLDEPTVRTAVTAERSFLRALEGGCQIPIGALANNDAGKLELRGFVGAVDGSLLIRGEIEGDASEAVVLGLRLAASLREKGADDILRDIRLQAPRHPPSNDAP